MTMHTRSRPRRSAFALRAWVAFATLGLVSFACYAELEPSDPSRPGPSTGGAHSGGSGGASPGRGGDAGIEERPSVCGDADLASDEECDDGNSQGGDGCSPTCSIEARSEAVCGDGERSEQEACDDGNLQSGDGCDATCDVEECGNERIDAGEECDPPRARECTDNCAIERPRCGDGVVQEQDQEECDDRNEQAGDGCFECRKECGDGRIDRKAGEECDPAQSSACSEACLWLPVCGDGIVQRELGEECDPSRGNCVNCKRVDVPPPDPPSCNGGAGGGSGAGGEGQCPPERCLPSLGADLVQNGNFESGTTGWSPHARSVEIKASSAEALEPPALEVSLAASPVRSVSGAVQCIPVFAGARYQFRADYRIPDDAPEGVGANAMAFLYPGTRCDGEFVRPAVTGPAGGVRGAWSRYQFNIDTSPLIGASPSGEGRMLLRLGAIAPAEARGVRVWWDGVSLAGRCGNCEVEAGETCDDGNAESGDGCSASCRLEICGDGVQSRAEQCDDGNATFGGEGDACTPSCRTPSACDLCARPRCANEMANCLALEGTAEAGPAAGTARSTLCDRLRSCVKETACDRAKRYTGQGTELPYLENCYCGTAGPGCFKGQANGSCRAEVEAALETTDPLTVAQRFRGSDVRYPVTQALDALLTCEGLGGGECPSICNPAPRCGDGRVQDRNLEFEFIVEGQEVQCRDEFTHTGRGCSFEECDDSNAQAADGCDEHCFVEACGNRVIQAGEECDDGNTESGDGCGAECELEFNCGNSVLEAPFEECEPPDPSGGHVCTNAEYQRDPSQCGCDSSCRRTVCGDGRVQRPAEQCDPPQAGFCTDECQYADQTPCEECLLADPNLGPFYLEYCTTVECIDVIRCEVQAECFATIQSNCYCGAGVSVQDCIDPGFVPQGACADVIRTGTLSPGEEETLENVNVTVVDERWFAEQRPGGIAHLILNDVVDPGHACHSACFPGATLP